MLNSPYHLTQFYPGLRVPAVCRDGVTRSAVAGNGCTSVLCQYPGCIVSPVAVQVTVAGKRRTVTGYLEIDAAGLVSFHARLRLRNAAMVPLTSHRPRLAAAALRLIKATAYGRGAPGYIWDWPADHAAALAGGCRYWYGTSEWPQGGFAARAVLKRLPADLLPRLAAFFDRYSRFLAMGEQPRPSTPPPPPPFA